MKANERIKEAVEKVPDWEPAEVDVIEPLAGGPSSETFLVERFGQRCKLRIDLPLARSLHLDRSAELNAHNAAAQAGIAPPVLVALPEDGILITEYREGRAWGPEDLANAGQRARLGARLRELHALRPAGVPRFDLGGALRRYAARIGSDKAHALARQGLEALDEIGHGDSALCHNDLIAANVIEGSRLWLIDFEYAAIGDPLFDVAVVAAHHDLDENARLDLLSARFGSAGAALPVPLNMYCTVYASLLALWNEVTADDEALPSVLAAHGADGHSVGETTEPELT